MNVWEPPIKGLPRSMIRDLTVEIRQDGVWNVLKTVCDNERRLIRVPLGAAIDGVRVRIDKTWGNEEIRVFAVTVHGTDD